MFDVDFDFEILPETRVVLFVSSRKGFNSNRFKFSIRFPFDSDLNFDLKLDFDSIFDFAFVFESLPQIRFGSTFRYRIDSIRFDLDFDFRFDFESSRFYWTRFDSSRIFDSLSIRFEFD